MMRISMYILIMMLGLTGCNDNNNQGKLYEQERNALDRAKAVDASVQKQAQDLQHSLSQQNGEKPAQSSQP